MSEVNDGGAAFPALCHSINGIPLAPGMYLRDYFAAKAMQSMVRLNGMDSIEYHQRGVASQAYKMADAMLAERKKRK